MENNLLNLVSSLILLSLVFHPAQAQHDLYRLVVEDCVNIESGVERSFKLLGYCFWIIDTVNVTSWSDTSALCESQSGTLAEIVTEEINTALAQELERPAFIGYRKHMDGSWASMGPYKNFSKPFVENGGVHMAIMPTTGNWEPSNIDSRGYLYNALCSLQMDPFLRCDDIEVAYSTTNNLIPYYAGESVTFTCVTGYHVTVGRKVQSLECLPHKKWSYAVVDCIPVECALYDPPAYTIRDSEKYHVADVVNYMCIEPDTYFAPGVIAKGFTCGHDGLWSPPLRACEYMRCEPPPTLDMGYVDTTSTLYGRRITYTCLAGYLFPDGSVSKKIECVGNPPTWQPTSVIAEFTCLPSSCPGDPKSGEVFNPIAQDPLRPQLYSVGHYQIWFCAKGYEHGNKQIGTVSQCQQESLANPAKWSKTIPDCYNIGCRTTSVADTHSQMSQDNYPFQTMMKYNCTRERGLFPGGYNEIVVTCGEDGQWDTQLILSGCDDTSCEEGWINHEGSCYFFSDGDSLGLRYEYAEDSCSRRLANLALIESQEESEWISTNTYDVYERGFWIGYHLGPDNEWIWKGTLTSNYTNFAEGYPEFFNCARITTRGYWKDRHCDSLMPYICKKTSICGASPEIEFGTATSVPYFPVNVLTPVTYVCDEGYRFKNGGYNKTIYCEYGGFWSNITNCVPDICPPIYPPEYEVPYAWFDRTDNAIGSDIMFTCQTGYLFPDRNRTKTITCMPYGVWSELPPACELFECLIPAVPDTSPRNGSTHWGAMDYYSCNPGYSFADGEVEKLFMCTADGIWQPQEQICIRRSCPKYSLPFATAVPDEGVFEDIITVQCNSGYEFADTGKQRKLKCETSGQWSLDLDPCVPTECEGPTPPNVTDAFRDTDAIISGTVVNYTCLYGLVYINGDKSRQAFCSRETLLWTNVPSGCVEAPTEIETEFYHPPVEAPGAVTFGVFGIALIVVVILIIVGLDAATLQKFLPESCKKKPVEDVKTPEDIEAAKKAAEEKKEREKAEKRERWRRRDETPEPERRQRKQQTPEHGSEIEEGDEEEEEEEDSEYEYVTDSQATTEYETDDD